MVNLFSISFLDYFVSNKNYINGILSKVGYVMLTVVVGLDMP